MKINKKFLERMSLCSMSAEAAIEELGNPTSCTYDGWVWLSWDHDGHQLCVSAGFDERARKPVCECCLYMDSHDDAVTKEFDITTDKGFRRMMKLAKKVGIL